MLGEKVLWMDRRNLEPFLKLKFFVLGVFFKLLIALTEVYSWGEHTLVLEP